MLYAQNKSFVNFVTEKFSCFARGGKLRAKVNHSWWQYITHCTAMNRAIFVSITHSTEHTIFSNAPHTAFYLGHFLKHITSHWFQKSEAVFSNTSKSAAAVVSLTFGHLLKHIAHTIA